MYGLIIAFQDFDIFKGYWGSPWVGLKHFEVLFADQNFLLAVRNTLVISFMKLVFSFPVPIIFALLLNELRNAAFKRTIQTVTYLPHFVAWVFVAGYIFTFLSTSDTGVLNNVLLALGLIEEPIFFMGNPAYYRWILVFSDMWKSFGWGSIVYLAAISSINPELYESATIDGANWFQKIIRITLPSILPTVMILLILTISNLMNMSFDQVWLTISPLTQDVGEIIETFVFRMGIQLNRFSFAAAAGLFKSVVATVLLLAANWLSNRLTQQGLF
jgi:putative aldouronate transport system permease protein